MRLSLIMKLMLTSDFNNRFAKFVCKSNEDCIKFKESLLTYKDNFTIENISFDGLHFYSLKQMFKKCTEINSFFQSC